MYWKWFEDDITDLVMDGKKSERVETLVGKVLEFVTDVGWKEPRFFWLGEFGNCFPMEDAYETVEMNESRRANAYFMLHNYSGKLRRESSLVSVNGFFVDVDTKHGNVKDYAELESRLAFLGLVPHYVVSTAGGWHVHFLTEPIPYRKNVRFVKNLQTYLTEFLWGDPKFVYATWIMKVPYLDDVFKGGKISVAAANKFPKYRFDALKKEFGAKATSYVVFRPDPADAAKTAAEPVNAPEPETSVRGKKASAYEAVANLPVWELVPRMFEYAKSRGFEHPYSYDEAGFVLKDGKRMKQLAVDFGRNKLHDFSGRTEKFSGGPRSFVNGFVTHLFEEFPRRGDSGAGKERRYALRAEFLRSEFGISWRPPGSVSLPKEIFASLVADAVVPSAEFSEAGGDSVWDRTLGSETGRAAIASRAPRESARLFNVLAIGRSWKGANAVRTLLNLVAFCDSKGLRKIGKVSVKEVFGERFAKASFGNAGFVEARLSEIATLKLLRGFGKDRDGKQTMFRFVDVPWIDWDSGTFWFELFPDADFSLIQNRVSHFVPWKAAGPASKNPKFSSFASWLAWEAGVSGRTAFPASEIRRMLGISEASRNWKRGCSSALSTVAKWYGKKAKFSYSKSSSEFSVDLAGKSGKGKPSEKRLTKQDV